MIYRIEIKRIAVLHEYLRLIGEKGFSSITYRIDIYKNNNPFRSYSCGSICPRKRLTLGFLKSLELEGKFPIENMDYLLKIYEEKEILGLGYEIQDLD